jgi:hypothetical protein
MRYDHPCSVAGAPSCTSPGLNIGTAPGSKNCLERRTSQRSTPPRMSPNE